MAFSLNPFADLTEIFYYPFMQHAFEAGTVVAIVAGIVGYFVVLRRSSFAAHALSHVGFAGAAGAALVGVSPVYGLLVFTTVGGSTMAALSPRAAHRDVHIGTVLAFMLGLGVLFSSLYSGGVSAAYSILFGQILAISNSDVLLTLVAGLIILAAVAVVYRPLLFSSLDEDVAEAKGAYILAWDSVHAAGRSCDIDCRPSSWRPSHLLTDGHARSNRSAISETAATSHGDFHSHRGDGDVVRPLHCLLRTLSSKFLYNDHSFCAVPGCQALPAKNYTGSSSTGRCFRVN
jgi:hypothetical protein